MANCLVKRVAKLIRNTYKILHALYDKFIRCYYAISLVLRSIKKARDHLFFFTFKIASVVCVHLAADCLVGKVSLKRPCQVFVRVAKHDSNINFAIHSPILCCVK